MDEQLRRWVDAVFPSEVKQEFDRILPSDVQKAISEAAIQAHKKNWLGVMLARQDGGYAMPVRSDE